MYQPKRLAMLLSITMLLASAVILSGCRINCAPTDTACQTGISATYTVPVPPTATTLPAATDPKQPVQAFIDVYGGESTGYPTLATLFDSAYASVSPDAIACGADNTKQTYGGITSSSIHDPVVTDTVALVVVDVVAVSRSGPVNFTLKKDTTKGWLIDSITGWIGGDITATSPVGDSASCLTDSGSDSGGGSTTGSDTPGTGADTTPAPLP
jgi:hypothetical protein